jgi:hypothetical protein
MTAPKSLFWPSEAQTDYQKIVIATVLVTCGGDAINNCIIQLWHFGEINSGKVGI